METPKMTAMKTTTRMQLMDDHHLRPCRWGTHIAKTKYVAPKVIIQYGRVIASVLYRSCVPCNQ